MEEILDFKVPIHTGICKSLTLNTRNKKTVLYHTACAAAHCDLDVECEIIRSELHPLNFSPFQLQGKDAWVHFVSVRVINGSE